MLPNGRSFGIVRPVTGEVGTEEAEKKFQEIINSKNEHINKLADEALKGLEELDAQAKSKIPAGYFKSNFADDFQEMIDSNTTNEETIIEWLKISGGGHREVELSDDKGAVVDIVPPLFSNTPALSPEDNSDVKDMTQAMLLAGEEGECFHPLLDGENNKLEYLANIGLKLGQGILNDETNSENSMKFKQVVNKYSNKFTEQNLNDISAETNNHREDEDDMEFDIK